MWEDSLANHTTSGEKRCEHKVLQRRAKCGKGHSHRCPLNCKSSSGSQLPATERSLLAEATREVASELYREEQVGMTRKRRKGKALRGASGVSKH